MSQIIPAILEKTINEFEAKLRRIENISNIVQIDIMDGVFVNNKSFGEIEKINDIRTKIKFELHLMVEHPLVELKKWEKVKNITRVIFHIESKDDAAEVIHFCRQKNLEVGLALNPETKLTKIKHYLKSVDEILFLTVRPGHQGAPFLPEVGQKIIKFNKIKNHPLCAVDGGIKINNIAEVKSWGVDIFYIGGSLIMAEDVNDMYKQLLTALSLR